MTRTQIWLGVALLVAPIACGNPSNGVEVPDDATFCSVFAGQYSDALDAAAPITDPGFADASSLIVAWAEVLADLAPEEIIGSAADNVRYHRAQAGVRSAADFIEGSNAMHEWAATNC